MEATIQQNNISTNVSINIATFVASGQNALKSVKQRALKRANVGTLVSGLRFKVSLKSLYRRQLRLTMAAARTIEAHPIITDTVLWVLGGAVVIEAFLSL